MKSIILTRIRSSIYCVVFFLSTILIYWRIFFNEFQSQWDDHWVVLNSYTEQGFSFKNLRTILFNFYHAQYAPVNQLYYCLLYWIDGYNPFTFHLGSYFLHFLNTVLVFKVLKVLLYQPKLFSEISVLRISFIAALIFGVHPLMIESVAWVSASKVVLYSFFYFLAILSYLNYLGKKKVFYYFLTIFLFVLSFGAKEQAITFPICLVLIDFFLIRKLSWSNWLKKIPFFLISLIAGIITLLSQSADGEGILAGEESYSLFQKIILFSITVTEYFTKCLIPLNLSYLYPFPFQTTDKVSIYLLLYPILLLITLVSFFTWCKDRVVIFGVLFFAIHILLVSNAISLSRFAITADRYSYIGNLGIILCISYLYDKISVQTKNKLPTFLLGAYIIVLSFQSYIRIDDWKNSDTLKKEFRMNIKSRFHLQE